MLNIYDYLDPAEFINDRFQIIRAENPNFSLRAWAMRLGMKSHGPLHAILKKQRKIPIKFVPKMISTLKLNKDEAKYFEVLVDLQRAKTPEETDYYKVKLDKLSPVPLRELNDLEAYKYITDPVHLILAEMTQLRQFSESPIWIKQHFRMNLNIRDVEIMMNRLRQLGVIENKGDKIIKPVEHIYTKFETKSESIQNFHKLCSRMAIEQISEQDIEEKEYNAIAFNIKKKDLPKMKEEIRAFINKLVDDYEAKPHEGDDTYQLNVQLFSLTK